MKFFKGWMKSWSRDKDSGNEIASSSIPYSPGIGKDFGSGSQGLHFTIYNASGGRIVEFKKYDLKTDRQHTGLHIIRDDDNFAEQLSHIITMECLKGNG